MPRIRDFAEHSGERANSDILGVFQKSHGSYKTQSVALIEKSIPQQSINEEILAHEKTGDICA
jgi:hypothetical protein